MNWWAFWMTNRTIFGLNFPPIFRRRPSKKSLKNCSLFSGWFLLRTGWTFFLLVYWDHRWEGSQQDITSHRARWFKTCNWILGYKLLLRSLVYSSVPRTLWMSERILICYLIYYLLKNSLFISFKCALSFSPKKLKRYSTVHSKKLINLLF